MTIEYPGLRYWELSLLSDDDKVRIFDMALQVAKDTGKDFYEVYKITVEKYCAQKFVEKIKAQKETEETRKLKDDFIYEDRIDQLVADDKKIEETNEMLNEIANGDKAKEENVDEFTSYANKARAIDAMKYNEAYKRANEEKTKLLEEIHEMTKTADNHTATFIKIRDAERGVIDDDTYFDENYYNMNDNDSKAFGDKLKRLNDLSRKMNYYRISAMSDEELTALRDKELANYEEIIKKLTEYTHIFKQNDATTITFMDIVNNIKNKGSGRVGGINPNAYDYVYYRAEQFANKPGYEEISMKMLNQVLEACAKKVDELRGMDPEGFKEYKIEQMNLSGRKKVEYDVNAGVAFINIKPEFKEEEPAKTR